MVASKFLSFVLLFSLLIVATLAVTEDVESGGGKGGGGALVEEDKANSRSKRQLPGMSFFQRFFGRNREKNAEEPPHFSPQYRPDVSIEMRPPHTRSSYRDQGQVHQNPHISHEQQIESSYRDHGGHQPVHDPYKGQDDHKGFVIHEIHDPYKSSGGDIHQIHDPYKSSGGDIHEIHDPHSNGYGHEIHEIHDPHGGSYGHESHGSHGGSGGGSYKHGSYGHGDGKLGGYSHAHESGYPKYGEPPKKIKYGPYKGPNYGPYDLVAPDKSKKGKKSGYGDDPVNETKKGGYHKEKITQHFGGFGGGGSVGYKAHGGGYKGGGGHKGGGYKGGHKGGYKGGYKGGKKGGGGYSSHQVEYVEIHHEPAYYPQLEKPHNTYDPHAKQLVEYPEPSDNTHVDISQMLISDPYNTAASTTQSKEAQIDKGAKNLKAESRI